MAVTLEKSIASCEITLEIIYLHAMPLIIWFDYFHKVMVHYYTVWCCSAATIWKQNLCVVS